MDGKRIVNRTLASDSLGILVPRDALTQAAAPEETHPFPQAQVAWACMHARENKLTPMRVARPSRWTICLAQALGLMSSDIPGELILSTGRAKHLCRFVMGMSEEARASSISWAEAQLTTKKTKQKHDGIEAVKRNNL